MGIPAVQGYTFSPLGPEPGLTRRTLSREPLPAWVDVEVMQLAASVRLVCALLCLAVVLRQSGALAPVMAVALPGYALWAAMRWWHARSAASLPTGSVVDSVVDVAWGLLMLRAVPSLGALPLALLVPPFATAALLHGTRRALLLGMAASLAVLVEGPPWTWFAPALPPHAAERLGSADLAAAVALIALCSGLAMRPMEARRQRRARLLQRTADIDPRHGLETTAVQIARILRQSSGAPVVALSLPTMAGGHAWFSTDAEGDFAASASTQRQIEGLLADLPGQALSNAPLHPLARLFGTSAAGMARPAQGPLHGRLADLGRLLQIEHLAVIPLLRDGHRRGHALLGWHTPAAGPAGAADLAETAPDLTRLLEAAELIDQLQDEAAGHERSRIGRDLHDSAIQPYLGLKFAVESVARQAAADNPLRPDLDALAEMVNAEILTLRELISTLRTGSAQGDNALVPAVRRLVQRFSRLFGIEVQLDCPATLHTSRALAAAVFQLVNEALNNVRKHTGARRTWIRIEHRDQTLHLYIRDNAGTLQGRRMPDFVPAALAERVGDLGGLLEVGHADAFDTELHLSVPERP